MIEIEFDPAKDAQNRQKHGIGLAAALLIFGDRHLRQKSTVANDSNEERWYAVGRIEGRYMTCVYAMRGSVYRVISLRAARSKERREYEEAVGQD